MKGEHGIGKKGGERGEEDKERGGHGEKMEGWR